MRSFFVEDMTFLDALKLGDLGGYSTFGDYDNRGSFCVKQSLPGIVLKHLREVE